MFRNTLTAVALLLSVTTFSQKDDSYTSYFVSKNTNAATPVKNQAMTGTCWSFSTTSLFESQCIKNGGEELDLSEMFTVRNIYLEKAKNYLLRQGSTQFSEGGLGHDPVRAIATYGAMPESVYSGLLAGQTSHNHSKMVDTLKKYLDGKLKKLPLTPDWQAGFTAILDAHLGTPPAQFSYNNKQYTPHSFANEVLKFKADDYINITSFTHHPYYKPFILEQPDNFSNGAYYNLPLTEMISLVKDAASNGYTVMWDTDVSNSGWNTGKGIALFIDPASYKADEINPDINGQQTSAELRQKLFENLITVDDHLMHITGTAKTKGGKDFFIVKNSWGLIGPNKGYVNVSEDYFAINTISLVLPKAAIPKNLLAKLNIR